MTSTPHLNPQIIIARQQLLAQPASRITLLVAPPGSGKTVFAAQLARQPGHPVIWHSMDAWQRDVVELHRAALRAFQPLLPDIMKLANIDLSSASEAALQVTGYIQQHAEHPLVYVLDDVHWLAEHRQAELWLKTLVSNMPSHCYLILSGRSLPGLPVMELVARHEVRAINGEELQFSDDETALLATFTGAKWDSQRVHELTRQFRGWAAGITLALQESKTKQIPDSVQPETVFQTIAGEMLAGLPPELHHFLLAASTLEVITPERCSRILGITDSFKWLDMAMMRNLFLMQYPQGYILHDLFRNFLQATLKTTDEAQYSQWHQAAAAYFEKKQDYARAFYHYLQAGSFDRATRIASHIAQGYFVQGRWEVLRSFQQQLDEFNLSVAELDYVNSLITGELYEFSRAEDSLNRAEAGFRAENNQIGLWRVILHRAFLEYSRGNSQKAQQWLASLSMPDLPDNLSGMAFRLCGQVHARQGQFAEARNWLEQALPTFEATQDKAALCALLQDLSSVYMGLGEAAQAERVLSRLVALRREMGNRMLLSHAYVNLGHHFHLCGEYTRAYETLTEGLQMTALTADPRGTAYLAWNMGDLQRDRGHMDDALHWYHYAFEASTTLDPYVRSGVLLSLMTYYRWQGDFAQARQLGREVRMLANQHNLSLYARMAQFYDLSLSSDAAELALMQQILDSLLEQHALMQMLRGTGVFITAAQRHGDTAAVSQGFAMIQRVLDSGAGVQPFIAEAVHNPALLRLVTDERLMKQIRLLQEAAPPPLPAAVPAETFNLPMTHSLQITTLGRENIERDGQTVNPGEWRANAREVFFYLLFKGGQRREALIATFWAHHHNGNAQNNFSQTIHRIRKALGNNVILLANEIYQINPNVEIECDALDLIQLVQQARQLSPRHLMTQDLWQRAIQLYQGEFLPNISSTWMMDWREKLAKHYVEALLGFAECLVFHHKDYSTAVDCYKRAREFEPYREDIYRAWMLVCEKQGDRKQIEKLMDELENLLEKDLNTPPSDETFKLFIRLTQTH